MPERESFRRERGSSRERIDAAALRLLALNGYSGLSLQAIADDVGLHKSTLFHHYKSKAEIVNHVVLRVLDQIAGHVLEHLAVEEPHLDQIVALSRRLVVYFANAPDAAKLLFRVVLAPVESPMAPDLFEKHPLAVMIRTLTVWFRNARSCGVIRHVRIRHALMDLMGVLVFQPAAAGQMRYLTGPEPFDAGEIDKRQEEVAAFILRALQPIPN